MKLKDIISEYRTENNLTQRLTRLKWQFCPLWNVFSTHTPARKR